MTASTDRPVVRPRSGRRPIPPLIFLLVLALAALAVWWNVLRDAAEAEQANDAACASAEAAPPSLDPATVSVRVFNATDTAGLAQQVAAELQSRGFVVDEIANDPEDREVTGVGEIRHGKPGADVARFLRVLLPTAELFEDTRPTAQVDLVIGPQFAGLASTDEVAAGLAGGAEAAAACDTAAPVAAG
ncbi:LytR C-terminal domain-containing protein [Blastococcus sp. SYSU D00820]